MAGAPRKGWTGVTLSHGKQCAQAALRDLEPWTCQRNEVRKCSIWGQFYTRVQSSSAQAARHLPLAKAGTNLCSACKRRQLRTLPLLRLAHWNVCKRVCFTEINTLGVQDLADRELPTVRQREGKFQLTSCRRERRSWHRSQSWPGSVWGPAEWRKVGKRWDTTCLLEGGKCK